jgi:hypothetical protein
MAKIIIGIHGLGNKPPKNILNAWWKASMFEGFKRIKRPKPIFDFELVYWAHYLHPAPLKRRIKDKKDPLYLEDPYFPGPKNTEEKKPGELHQKILDYVSEQLENIFLNEDLTINYESIADFIIHNYFRELDIYYRNYCVRQNKQDCRAKEVICADLANVLKLNRRKKIMLIAHSMGSIIAYDVLTQYVPDVTIDTFVTLGSPLGMPITKSKIVAGHKNDPIRANGLKTPENVLSHWYNFSDLRDKIAVNYKLEDDFSENGRYVRPEDMVVINNYVYGDEKNPHKSYGYLRTPELAGVIAAFLGS